MEDDPIDDRLYARAREVFDAELAPHADAVARCAETAARVAEVAPPLPLAHAEILERGKGKGEGGRGGGAGEGGDGGRGDVGCAASDGGGDGDDGSGADAGGASASLCV